MLGGVVYDAHMKPLTKEQKEEFSNKNSQEKTKSQSKEIKQGGDDLEESAQLKKKRTRKQGKGVKL